MRVLPQAGVWALMLLLAGAGSAAAQSTVSQTDIQRLQDRIYDVSRNIQTVRSRDDASARQLQGQLDDLRDETIYLKVKIRKEGNVRYSEYADLRDRIDSLDAQARGTATSAGNTYGTPASGSTQTPTYGTQGAAGSAGAGVGTGGSTGGGGGASTRATVGAGSAYQVPVGTEMDVRLQERLSSDTTKVEDRFTATTMVDLSVNGRTVIPAGSVVRGVVTSVDPATRTNRTGKMTVSFDQITVNGRSYALRGTVTEALQSEGIRGEAGKIGAGAGVGAILGGILGGVKGALAGILIGGGGVVAATEGKDVELPQGATLRVRLDSALDIPASAVR